MITRRELDLEIALGNARLHGDLIVPGGAHGCVVFAHGSGSSRKSSRNRFVAELLQRAELGTFLFDLLTNEEEHRDALSGELRFNIPFLAERLAAVTEWLRSYSGPQPLGYFGASTGAAGALVASTSSNVQALVSRGGRPDLAADFLPRVSTPTLLIVGGKDGRVVDLNREAFSHLRCEKRLEVIPSATHLFEEPGALERVAELAADWFRQHLCRSG